MLKQIFDLMPERYRPGKLTDERTYYFSLGDARYTVRMDAETCEVTEGKAVERADVVLKTTPAIFEALVVEGKNPGAWDIARGRFKTNDVARLRQLRELFDMRKE